MYYVFDGNGIYIERQRGTRYEVQQVGRNLHLNVYIERQRGTRYEVQQVGRNLHLNGRPV